MFQFGGFPSVHYVFMYGSMVLHHGGFPIRKSAGQRLFPTNRSLSQVVASFFGSRCQGIHLMLFFAWTASLVFSFKTSLLHCLSFANNCLGCVTNCLHCFSAGASLLLWLVVVSHFSSERPFYFKKSFSIYNYLFRFCFLYSVFNEHLSLLRL